MYEQEAAQSAERRVGGNMSIVRGPLPNRNFTILDNPTLCDERLSYRALGVLSYLLSRPPGWRVNSDDLSAGEGREGRDAVRSALRELMEHGYMHRRKYQNEKGQHITESVIYDTPHTTPPVYELNPTTGSQSSGSRLSGSQSLIQELDVNTELGKSDISPVHNSNSACDACESGWLVDDSGNVAQRCPCGYRSPTPYDTSA